MPITVKPGSWSWVFDGKSIVDSGKVLDLSCELFLDDVLSYWGQNYLFRGPVSVRALVRGERSGISVELSLKGTGEVPCARCLEPAPLDISGVFLYFYRPLPGYENITEKPAEENGAESMILVDNIETEFDISDQVWESLILSLPEKVLCSESCLGICPCCGGNRNKVKCSCSPGKTDPRFDVLTGLMKEERDNAPGKGGDNNGNSEE